MVWWIWEYVTGKALELFGSVPWVILFRQTDRRMKVMEMGYILSLASADGKQHGKDETSELHVAWLAVVCGQHLIGILVRGIIIQFVTEIVVTWSKDEEKEERSIKQRGSDQALLLAYTTVNGDVEVCSSIIFSHFVDPVIA